MKTNKDKRGKALSRNPYLNFLSDFRKKAPKYERPVETVKRAAQEWRNMKHTEKIHYIREAFNAPLPIRKKYKRRRKYESEESEED